MRKRLVLITFIMFLSFATITSAAGSPFGSQPRIKDVSCNNNVFTVTFDPSITPGTPDNSCSATCGNNQKINLQWVVKLIGLDNNYQDTNNVITTNPRTDIFCAQTVAGGCINSVHTADNQDKLAYITRQISNVDCSKNYRVAIELTEKDSSQPNNYCAGVDPCNALSPDPARNQPPELTSLKIQPTDVNNLYINGNPTVSASVSSDVLKGVSCEVCFSSNSQVCTDKTSTSSAWIKGTVTDSGCSAQTSVPDGTQLNYAVRARDATGNTGIVSSPIPITVDSSSPIVTVTQLDAVQTSQSWTLSWTATDPMLPGNKQPSGLASKAYQVTKSVNGGDFAIVGDWQSLNYFTESGISQTDNQIFCYQVRARDGAGNTAGWSPSTCTKFILQCDRSNPTLVIGDGTLGQSSDSSYPYSLEFPITVKNNNNQLCKLNGASTSDLLMERTTQLPTNWYIDSVTIDNQNVGNSLPVHLNVGDGQSSNIKLRFKSANKIDTGSGLYSIGIRVTDQADQTISTSITKIYVVNQPYFTITSNNQVVVRGTEADYALTLTPQSNFNGNVQLSVKNCPTTCSFDNSQISLSQTAQATLKVTTSSNTLPGTYDFVVVATSGSLQVPLYLTLTVNLFGQQLVKGQNLVGYLPSSSSLASCNIGKFKSSHPKSDGSDCLYQNSFVYWDPTASGSGDCGTNYKSADSSQGGFGYYVFIGADSCYYTPNIPAHTTITLYPGQNLISSSRQIQLSEITNACGTSSIGVFYSSSKPGCQYQKSFVYFDAGGQANGDCGSQYKSTDTMQPYLGYFINFLGKNGDGQTSCSITVN